MIRIHRVERLLDNNKRQATQSLRCKHSCSEIIGRQHNLSGASTHVQKSEVDSAISQVQALMFRNKSQTPQPLSFKNFCSEIREREHTGAITRGREHNY